MLLSVGGIPTSRYRGSPCIPHHENLHRIYQMQNQINGPRAAAAAAATPS